MKRRGLQDADDLTCIYCQRTFETVTGKRSHQGGCFQRHQQRLRDEVAGEQGADGNWVLSDSGDEAAASAGDREGPGGAVGSSDLQLPQGTKPAEGEEGAASPAARLGQLGPEAAERPEPRRAELQQRERQEEERQQPEQEQQMGDEAMDEDDRFPQYGDDGRGSSGGGGGGGGAESSDPRSRQGCVTSRFEIDYGGFGIITGALAELQGGGEGASNLGDGFGSLEIGSGDDSGGSGDEGEVAKRPWKSGEEAAFTLSDEDEDDRAARQLSAEDLLTLRMYAKLSRDDFARYLRVINAWDSTSVAIKTVADAEAAVDDISPQVWDCHEKVFTFEAKDPHGRRFQREITVKAHTRRDIVRLLRASVGRTEAAALIEGARFARKGNGERFISSIFDADWLAKAEAQLHKHHRDSRARAAPYYIYTDGTMTSGRLKIQPLQWAPAWYSDYLAHKKGAMHTLAMLPIILGTDIADATEPAELRRQVKLWAMDPVMAVLRDLEQTGFDALGADGESRLFVPCLAATTCDWPEQCDLTNTRMLGCIIRFLVFKEDMAKSDAELAPLTPRTEAGINTAIAAANMPGSRAAKRRELDAYGVASTQRPMLAGFRYREMCEIAAPDMLHCVAIGVCNHVGGMKEAHDSALSLLVFRTLGMTKENKNRYSSVAYKAVVSTINAEIMGAPTFSGFRVPSKGLNTESLTAGENENMFALLPIALLSVAQGSGTRYEIPVGRIIEAITLVLEWQTLLKQRIVMEKDLQQLKEKRQELQEFLKKWFPFKNWAFPKFFLMRLFELLIRELGPLHAIDTNTGESEHKPWKQGYALTNKKGSSVVAQMINNVRQADAVRLAEEHEARMGETYNSMAKRAVSLLCAVVPTRQGVALIYTCLRGDGIGARAALLLQRPLLSHFEYAFRLFLGGSPWPAPLLAELPHALHRKVRLLSAMGVPYLRRMGELLRGVVLRATPKFGDREDCYDNVAIRAEQGQTWLAQLVAIFSYQLDVPPYQYQHAAFVRYYKTAPHTALTGVTGMERLTWDHHVLPGCLDEVPWCGVVSLDSVSEPIYVQRDPTAPDHFFRNHHVRCGGR